MPRERRGLALATWTILVTCGAFLACSSSDVQPPIDDPGSGTPHTGGSEGDGAVSCSGDDDGGCNHVALCGDTILIAEVASAPPVALGGTIVRGTYSLTSYTVYSGAGGPTNELFDPAQETFVFSGGSVGDAGAGASSVDASDDAGNADAAYADAASSAALQTIFGWDDVLLANDETSASHASGYITASGTDLSFIESCPVQNEADTTYTATSTTLKVYLTQTEGTSEAVYTRM